MNALDLWRKSASIHGEIMTVGCTDFLKAHATIWQAIGRLTEVRAAGRASTDTVNVENHLRNDAAAMEIAWRKAEVLS